MMSKRKREWEDYKEKISKKRTGKKKDEAGPSGLCGSITVQRLSPNVEGKCQKYSRIGALTLVPLEEEALCQTSRPHAKHILVQILNAMFWLENEVLLSPMLAKYKTGK